MWFMRHKKRQMRRIMDEFRVNDQFPASLNDFSIIFVWHKIKKNSPKYLWDASHLHVNRAVRKQHYQGRKNSFNANERRTKSNWLNCDTKWGRCVICYVRSPNVVLKVGAQPCNFCSAALSLHQINPSSQQQSVTAMRTTTARLLNWPFNPPSIYLIVWTGA